MGARIRVFLTDEEDRTLKELRQGINVPQRVKDRAEAVRLSAQGWYVERIARYLGWHVTTVREALKRWKKKGLGGLWDQDKPKKQCNWSQEDMVCVEKWLLEEQRTYNAKQLVIRLKEEINVDITEGHLRRILKARGICWKRSRSSHKAKQKEDLKAIKQADLDMLEMAAAAGAIDLYYGDESGCSPWSDPSYSYYFKGQQKRIEQTVQGKRVNIMGFFQKLGTFFYGIIIGKVTSKTFIKLIDEQA